MDTTTRMPSRKNPRTMFRSLLRVFADWGQIFRQWPHRMHLSGMMTARSSLTWMAFTPQ